ncbi:MAG: DUF805 domain-containing protein [Betaproteobacteria bacterium]
MNTTAENPFQAPQAPVRDQNETTVQPRLLAVSGRLNRARYIAYSMFVSIVAMLAIGLLAAILVPVSPTLGMTIAVIGYIAMFVLHFMLTIQRCHDFNVTGWLSPLVIVPLGVFVFWFVPGTATENKYGAPNPPNSTLTIIAILILPIIAVIGILAAIAIPAYHDYTERAKAAQMKQVTPPQIQQPVQQ